jgi:hypothetical protein
MEETISSNRSDAKLEDIIYELAVNFLLYVVLIIVFYMLTRFYLEEETSTPDGYMAVATDEMDDVQLVDKPSTTDSVDKSSIGSPTPKSSVFLSINEWGEPEGTKEEVIQRAVICAVGLIVSFSIWGLVQERLLTQTYDGEFFRYSYGLVFINRLGGLVLSSFLMYYLKLEWQSSRLWEYSFPSVANMLSSWCQYEALQFVSFPAAMLAKAFKMVPVMLMVWFQIRCFACCFAFSFLSYCISTGQVHE